MEKKILEKIIEEGESEDSATQLASTPLGNTIRGRYWKFNLNNPTRDEMTQFDDYIKKNAEEYSWQLEVGNKNFTEHIEGTFYFVNNRYLQTLKNRFPRAHIEKSEKKNFVKSRKYCNKLSTRVAYGSSSPPFVKYRYGKISGKLHLWQVNILKTISCYTDDRKILWVWSESGSLGKTQFCKKLLIENEGKILYAKGNERHIKQLIAKHIQIKKKEPEIFLINIVKEGKINYEFLEELKDGLFNCCHYEGVTVCLSTSPHVLIFANIPPKTLLNGRIIPMEISRDECF